MTTYTAIANADIDADSPITTSLMTLLRDNPIAITEGASGAPTIATAAIAASAVSQSKLKTTTALTTTTHTYTGAGAAFGNTRVTLVGGGYSFWSVTTKFDLVSGSCDSLTMYVGRQVPGTVTDVGSDGGVGVIDLSSGVLTQPTSGSAYFYTNERYVQASPPYGTSTEDWPLFAYAVRRISTGKIEHVSCAPDPIWAYHGPTNICWDFKDVDGRLKKKCKAVDANKLAKNIIKAIKDKNIVEQEKLFIAYKESPIIDIEITKDYKNSDMHTHPHPWMYDVNIMSDPDVEIILLEPRRTERLHILHEAGEDVGALLTSGVITIGAEVLDHVKPNSVKCYSFSFN